MIVNQNQSDTNRTMSLDEFIRCCRFYFVIFVFDFVALHKAKSDAQHRSQVQDKWNGKWDQLRYWFDLFLLRTVRFVRILCFVRLAGGPFDCRRHYLSTSINCSGQETRTISAINIQLALQRLMQRHLSAWARFCHPVKSYTRQYRQWQQSDKPEIALMKPLLCNHQKLLHTKSAEWKISVFFSSPSSLSSSTLLLHIRFRQRRPQSHFTAQRRDPFTNNHRISTFYRIQTCSFMQIVFLSFVFVLFGAIFERRRRRWK